METNVTTPQTRFTTQQRKWMPSSEVGVGTIDLQPHNRIQSKLGVTTLHGDKLQINE